MALTPMMQKYLETKEEYKDCILFYRLGDFYEMFFDDAKIVSKELELTLTGKSCGLEERAPMCGVPFHAVDGYLDKLISRGYKVAICEQVEDPKLAKGLVKREVVRVATPGTNLNMQALDESRNNYLLCVVYTTNAYGVSYVDVTTGDYYVTEFDSENKLLDEIGKTMPSEIICNDSFLVSGVDLEDLRGRLKIVVSAIDPWHFDEDRCVDSLCRHFHVGSLDGLGLADYSIGVTAAGAIMQYLERRHRRFLWITSQRSSHMYQTAICCWIGPPEEIWSFVRQCVKRPREARFSGYWTRPKQPWGQESFVIPSSSRFWIRIRSTGVWMPLKR